MHSSAWLERPAGVQREGREFDPRRSRQYI